MLSVWPKVTPASIEPLIFTVWQLLLVMLYTGEGLPVVVVVVVELRPEVLLWFKMGLVLLLKLLLEVDIVGEGCEEIRFFTV